MTSPFMRCLRIRALTRRWVVARLILVEAAAFTLRQVALRPTGSLTSNGALCSLVITPRGATTSCAYTRTLQRQTSGLMWSMARSTAPGLRSYGQAACRATALEASRPQTSATLRLARLLATVRVLTRRPVAEVQAPHLLRQQQLPPQPQRRRQQQLRRREHQRLQLRQQRPQRPLR